MTNAAAEASNSILNARLQFPVAWYGAVSPPMTRSHSPDPAKTRAPGSPDPVSYAPGPTCPSMAEYPPAAQRQTQPGPEWHSPARPGCGSGGGAAPQDSR